MLVSNENSFIDCPFRSKLLRHNAILSRLFLPFSYRKRLENTLKRKEYIIYICAYNGKIEIVAIKAGLKENLK